MKRKLLCLMMICCLMGMPVSARSTFNDTNYPAQVQVTGSSVNVRSGPAAWYTRVGIVYKGNLLNCIGKIGSWFAVHLDNDTIGMISGNYSKPYYPPTTPTPTATPAPTQKPVQTPAATSGATAEETQMLTLVNNARAAAGAAPLTMDKDLLKLARLKSTDMVNLSYFSHTSPTYGTPFQMLKSFGISYRSAGENIAAHSSVSTAHTALMNSPGHRANILNTSYTLVGIGVVTSPRYGKMITQLFVGR